MMLELRKSLARVAHELTALKSESSGSQESLGPAPKSSSADPPALQDKLEAKGESQVAVLVQTGCSWLPYHDVDVSPTRVWQSQPSASTQTDTHNGTETGAVHHENMQNHSYGAHTRTGPE